MLPLCRKGIEMLGSVCVCCFLGIHAWEDLRRQEISVRILGSFGAVGIAYALLERGGVLPEILWGFLPGAVLLAMGRLSREAVGYGDGSVVLVLGLYLSLWEILGMLAAASLLAALWAIGLLAAGRNGCRRIPFLPFLLVGFLITWAASSCA